MMTTIWILSGVILALFVSIFVAAFFVVFFRRRREAAVERAMQENRVTFRQQREWLEARFFTLASESGRPRGLAWVECDFDDEVAFARDRSTGELRALVAVNISFTAIEGGDMEDNPNVGRIRAATAIFLHRNGQWETDGRPIMNLDPQQAIDHFQQELEMVD